MLSLFCVAYFSAEIWLLAVTIFVIDPYAKTSGPALKLLRLLKPNFAQAVHTLYEPFAGYTNHTKR